MTKAESVKLEGFWDTANNIFKNVTQKRIREYTDAGKSSTVHIRRGDFQILLDEAVSASLLMNKIGNSFFREYGQLYISPRLDYISIRDRRPNGGCVRFKLLKSRG